MNNLEKLANEQIPDAVGLKEKTDRAWQIATHYHWRQLARRGMAMLQSRLKRKRVVGEIALPSRPEFVNSDRLRQLARVITSSKANHYCHRHNDLATGTLTLLNEKRSLRKAEPGIHWSCDLKDSPHLWRFQLQYHEFLLSWVADRELIDCPSDKKWQLVWGIIVDWIEEFDPPNTLDTSDAWHPYCISRRLPVWIWLLALSQPDEEIQNRIVESLAKQAVWLHQHLELDLRGNHLFENLTALVITATALGCSLTTDWLATACTYLKVELPTQILTHGEHYELSPMYHCQILGNIQRMQICLHDQHCNGKKESSNEIVELCRNYGPKMMRFLRCITCPDGEIPLLSDSGLGEAPSVAEINDLSTLLDWESPNLQDSNHHSTGTIECGPYWVKTSANKDSNEVDWLLFDRGEICADGLPAHGHCDMGNFVASIAGKRWFVDSGNFDYEDSSMRRYCRSSIAHNVVTVGHENHCRIWSKFRMGRRAQVVDRDSGQEAGIEWAKVSYAYRLVGRSREFERHIGMDLKNHCWICVDTANGSRQPPMFGYLHLHSLVQIRQEGGHWLLNDGHTCRRLTFFGVDNVEQNQGWYCTGFGCREENSAIVYRRDIKQGDRFGWVLSPDSTYPSIRLNEKTIQFEYLDSNGSSRESSTAGWQLDKH